MIMEYFLDRLRDRLRVTAKSRRGECVSSSTRSAIHRWRFRGGQGKLLWK